jgi:hypothetical protein
MSRLGNPSPQPSGASRYAAPIAQQHVATTAKHQDVDSEKAPAESKKLKSFHLVPAVRHRIVEIKLLLDKMTGRSISESEIVSRAILALSDEDAQRLFATRD